MSTKQKYKEIQSKIKKLYEEQIATARSYFAEGAREFFDHFPEVDSFSWHQCHPWNDGDTTYFIASTDVYEVEINGGRCIYGAAPDKKEINEDNGLTHHRTYEAASSVSDFLTCIEDCLEDLFGESSEITVTRNGVEVEDYYE